MNLVNDPWIPVVLQDGMSSLVSLNDAFAQGHEIVDLDVLPHERISIMRLFVCVAQVALDGPETYAKWLKCQDEIVPLSCTYLQKWKDQFELFGKGPRFLQLHGLALDEMKAKKKSKKIDGEDGIGAKAGTSKLDLTLASGDNPTLFDNGATAGSREFSRARLALTLLSFQCFAPGGRIGKAFWNGTATKGNGASIHAPCSGSIIHAIIREKNLILSIYNNLITKHDSRLVHGDEGWGRPIWELMPQSLDDSVSTKNATMTYLGRLLPVSRAIHLLDQKSMILANGLEYKPCPAFREAAISSQVSKPDPVKASPQKAIWRELQSLITKNKDQLTGPLIWQKFQGDRDVDLWTGALCCNQSKVLDSIESSFFISSAMLEDQGRERYEKGVLYANQCTQNLRDAIRSYAETLKIDSKTAKKMWEAASLHFWTTIENEVAILLKQASLSNSTNPWEEFTRKCAVEVYRASCPQGTSRQIEAFSKGQNKFDTMSPKNSKPRKRK